jgi:hypothetical protein
MRQAHPFPLRYRFGHGERKLNVSVGIGMQIGEEESRFIEVFADLNGASVERPLLPFRRYYSPVVSVPFLAAVIAALILYYHPDRFLDLVPVFVSVTQPLPAGSGTAPGAADFANVRLPRMLMPMPPPHP